MTLFSHQYWQIGQYLAPSPLLCHLLSLLSPLYCEVSCLASLPRRLQKISWMPSFPLTHWFLFEDFVLHWGRERSGCALASRAYAPAISVFSSLYSRQAVGCWSSGSLLLTPCLESLMGISFPANTLVGLQFHQPFVCTLIMLS